MGIREHDAVGAWEAGEVVIEEGELRHVVEGRSYATKPVYDETVEDYLKPVFQSCYTMSFENYPVEAERVHGMEVVEPSVSR